MSNVPTPGYTAIGIALVLFAIPFGLSLGPLVLGVVLAIIGLRRLHRGLADDADPVTRDPLVLAG